ncbi:MAG: hypothetical protein COA42_03090 [Alteromonadaceae bacterium]|nr:MAG: hypothetical protein COA42_03090 [Alteromonadaceae bacterium]
MISLPLLTAFRRVSAKYLWTRANGLLLTIIIAACASAPTEQESSTGGTLADIDLVRKPSQEVQIVENKKTKNKTAKNKSKQNGAPQKNTEQIRQAYEAYVNTAASNDRSRKKALTRLAQLEMDLSLSLSGQEDVQNDSQGGKKNQHATDISEQADKSLKRTIELLETTLHDYPKASDNDRVLYQLAQAYDSVGQHYLSTNSLKRLVSEFPQSDHYAESQFRLAEGAFVSGDYISAEDAYTEAILSTGNEQFYEKSLFKRGWSRYKQSFFMEAADDYLRAINYHEFQEYAKLSDSDKAHFNEYFRALGLAFAYQHGQVDVAQHLRKHPNFKFVYATHAAISDIFLVQRRFSDAAQILTKYTEAYPKSKRLPEAERRIIAAWKDGQFGERLYLAIERFYQLFQAKATYWQAHANSEHYELTQEKLRDYTTQMSAFYHKNYQKRAKQADFQQANKWYQRYVRHFTPYAHKDNIYALYAELLLEGKQKTKALGFFVKAAYNDDIILDKQSAYTTIVLTEELQRETKAEAQNKWREQYLSYAQRYLELYPEDTHSSTITKAAAESAFRAKQYDTVITMANLLPNKTDSSIHYTIDLLKAQALLETREYSDAEAVYLQLLESPERIRKQAKSKRKTLEDSVALAIYRQAEQAHEDQQHILALQHYTRIAKQSPSSPLAATGMYDAIAMSMKNEQWRQSIVLIQTFKQSYPKHKRINDISKSLSVAYLNSDQEGKAAAEFENIAKFEADVEVKKAALWRAAELYENKKQSDRAIRAYREYAHSYKKPFAQSMEAMLKLSELYQATKEPQKAYFWRNKIRVADQRATERVKTERTTYIASNATLTLARNEMKRFNKLKLKAPFKRSLKRKKTSMRESLRLFGQASGYAIQEITTEATRSTGDIYLSFSQALLDSERPGHLSEQELEQYNILLEDQAFPLEEKAIELYETNMARTRDNIYDDHIAQSLAQLKALFPTSYSRTGKTEVYRD